MKSKTELEQIAREIIKNTNRDVVWGAEFEIYKHDVWERILFALQRVQDEALQARLPSPDDGRGAMDRYLRECEAEGLEPTAWGAYYAAFEFIRANMLQNDEKANASSERGSSENMKPAPQMPSEYEIEDAAAEWSRKSVHRKAQDFYEGARWLKAQLRNGPKKDGA